MVTIPVATEEEARVIYRQQKDLYGADIIEAYTADRKVS